MTRPIRTLTTDNLHHVLVEKLDWEFSYSLIATQDRFEHRPYTRIVVLSISGTITKGDKNGISTATLFVYPKEFDERQSSNGPIGSGSKKKEHIEFVTQLPQQDIHGILAVAGSGRLNALSLAFSSFKWNRATLHSISFNTMVDEDNW